MKGYMYILECADGSYYTGSTKDLEKRLWEHDNFLGANYTRKKHPSKLVYVEQYPRIDQAFYREKQVQGWSHAKKRALINANKDKLIELSKNYTQYPRSTGVSARFGKGTSTCSVPGSDQIASECSKAVAEPFSRPVAEPVEATPIARRKR
jgi:putative endonuclease